MSSLPLRMNWDKASDRWASIINPVIENELNNGILLQNVNIVSGSNVINHKLSRMQQGWFIVDQNAACTFYRSAAFNNLTLTLTASAPCVISLWVF